jgi:hypothetical protein
VQPLPPAPTLSSVVPEAGRFFCCEGEKIFWWILFPIVENRELLRLSSGEDAGSVNFGNRGKYVFALYVRGDHLGHQTFQVFRSYFKAADRFLPAICYCPNCRLAIAPQLSLSTSRICPLSSFTLFERPSQDLSLQGSERRRIKAMVLAQKGRNLSDTFLKSVSKSYSDYEGCWLNVMFQKKFLDLFRSFNPRFRYPPMRAE